MNIESMSRMSLVTYADALFFCKISFFAKGRLTLLLERVIMEKKQIAYIKPLQK